MKRKNRNSASQNTNRAPKILYKYLHPDRIDIIENYCVRFTPPSALNDPFELRPSFKLPSRSSDLFTDILGDSSLENLIGKELSAEQIYIVKEKINHIKETNPEIQEQLLKLFVPFFEIGWKSIIEKFGILSLTEHNDHLLMWSHYAAQHTGLAIGFDPNIKFDCDHDKGKNELFQPHSVMYSSQRPAIELDECKLKSDDLLINFFTRKSQEWKYEREWRLIRPLSMSNKNIKIEDGLNINLFNFPPHFIKEIIIGAKTHTSIMSKIVVLIRNNPHLHHVNLIKSTIDRSMYRVNFHPVRYLQDRSQIAADLSFNPEIINMKESAKEFYDKIEINSGIKLIY